MDKGGEETGKAAAAARSATPRARRRKRSRKRRRFDLRKALFVLPNLFTLSSVFCGFFAITLVVDHAGPTELFRATLAVIFGLFFDGADGRVARMTRTQSEFGMQLDSLADVITFGVAPAMIVYRWALSDLGILGAFIAFSFVACGAMRLARFNVMAAREVDDASSAFTGLPIPVAAALLMTLVMAHQHLLGVPPKHTQHIVILVLVTAYLMVSNVRYRSFKKVTVGARSLMVLALLIGSFVAVAVAWHTTFALFAGFCVYIMLGLVEEVVFFRRRRREAADRRAAAAALNDNPDGPGAVVP